MSKTDFQLRLLDEMEEGVWYSVYRGKILSVPKGKGHYPDEERQRREGLPLPELPEWFYRKQSQPMRTISGLNKPFKQVVIKYVDGWPVVC